MGALQIIPGGNAVFPVTALTPPARGRYEAISRLTLEALSEQKPPGAPTKSCGAKQAKKRWRFFMEGSVITKEAVILGVAQPIMSHRYISNNIPTILR